MDIRADEPPFRADKSAMKSCFSLLQNNLLDRRRWLPGQDPNWPSTWIERTLSSPGDGKNGWGKFAPIEYEQSIGPR